MENELTIKETPEQDLLSAILLRALRDAQGQLCPYKDGANNNFVWASETQTEALAWLSSPSHEPFSYLWLKDHLTNIISIQTFQKIETAFRKQKTPREDLSSRRASIGARP